MNPRTDWPNIVAEIANTVRIHSLPDGDARILTQRKDTPTNEG